MRRVLTTGGRLRHAATMISGLALIVVFLLAALPARAVEVQELVTPGGITVWLVRDETAPIVSVDVAFRAGAAHEPDGKEGLAGMLSSLIEEGAGDLDALAFQTRLEDLSVSMNFSAGRDSFRATLRTLSRNRVEAFRLLRLALTEPRFDPEPVERIRRGTIATYRRSLDNPGSIAQRAWYGAAFPDHPYGRTTIGTEETLASIGPDDFRAFMTAHLTRDRMFVGVVGDIDPKELAKLVDETFLGLPEKGAAATIPKVEPVLSGEVAVERLDRPQSTVVFGQAGLSRHDPDFYAAFVMNHILGGGSFSSRLYQEVREKRGLAYSVGSSLSMLDAAPLVVGSVGTMNERVAESIAVIREQWSLMAENGVDEAELEEAKKYLTGSFALRFASSSNIASMLSALQMDGIGTDFFEIRNSLVEAVTVDDIRRVAGRLLDPGKLTFVVVGNPPGL